VYAVVCMLLYGHLSSVGLFLLSCGVSVTSVVFIIVSLVSFVSAVLGQAAGRRFQVGWGLGWAAGVVLEEFAELGDQCPCQN